LFRRRIAGDAAFDYSPALRQAGAERQTWTLEKLDAFLTDPEAMFPGTWMTAPPPLASAERRALVGFLADPNSR
jgi:cytochrome c2